MEAELTGNYQSSYLLETLFILEQLQVLLQLQVVFLKEAIKRLLHVSELGQEPKTQTTHMFTKAAR